MPLLASPGRGPSLHPFEPAWGPTDTLRTECRALRDRLSTLSREHDDATAANARLARELAALRQEVDGLREAQRELGVRTKVTVPVGRVTLVLPHRGQQAWSGGLCRRGRGRPSSVCGGRRTGGGEGRGRGGCGVFMGPCSGRETTSSPALALQDVGVVAEAVHGLRGDVAGLRDVTMALSTGADDTNRALQVIDTPPLLAAPAPPPHLPSPPFPAAFPH